MVKGKKSKLTESEKEQKKQAKRDRVLEFAPKRMVKMVKACKQVERIAGYPLYDSEKAQIIECATEAYDGIVSAFAGKQKKVAEFQFTEPEQG